MKVLVVDDNDDAATATAMMLQHFDCDVSVTHDGESTLRRVPEFAPCVVLLDISLPDMDGTQVARLLRSNGYAGALVALSGHSDEPTISRCKAVGFDEFIVKPCDIKQLLTVLKRAVEGSNPTRTEGSTESAASSK